MFNPSYLITSINFIYRHVYTIYTQNKAFLMSPCPLELWFTNEVDLTVRKKYKATPFMYSLKWYFYLRYSYLLGSEAPIRSINLVLFTSVEARNNIFQNFLSSHIYDSSKVHHFVNSIIYGLPSPFHISYTKWKLLAWARQSQHC